MVGKIIEKKVNDFVKGEKGIPKSFFSVKCLYDYILTFKNSSIFSLKKKKYSQLHV